VSGDTIGRAVTAQEALEIIAAATTAAESSGVVISVAVVDPHGGLVGQLTMDGSKFISADLARGKAYASSAFRQDTTALEDKAVTRNKEVFYLTAAATQAGRVVISQGGVVLWRDGAVAGAIGISGTTPQGDEAIARDAAASAGFPPVDAEHARSVGEARVVNDGN
jgi:glc operon protein GlcG